MTTLTAPAPQRAGTLAGTLALTRLALRLDRVRLPVWIGVAAILPAGTAAQYTKLYPDDQAIRAVAGVLTNPSLVAINGPLYRPTLGALTTWKILASEVILVALMSIFTVVRHTRTDEEAGRFELTGAGVTGRFAPLTAALVTAAGANAAVVVLDALGLAVSGLSPTGSLALALATGGAGLLFAAIAGVAAQLTESARAATGLAVTVLGLSYLLRAAGDAGASWLGWLSPLGWALRLRPFAGERWWVLGMTAAAALVCGAVAYALAGRRDLGAGLLPQRPGPAEAAPYLRGTFSLAWRLQRALLAGWIAGMALWGGTLGSAAGGIGDAIVTNHSITDMLTRLGGRKGLADAFLAAVIGITGILVAAYAVQATLRLRGEESAGRLEPILATPAGRIRWALGHLAFALGGTAVLMAVAGATAGLAYGLTTGDPGGQLLRLTGSALVQVPAAWVLAGVGTALFGLLPRFTALAWAALGACALVLEVGALLGVSSWIQDLSPFGYVPKLPGSPLSTAPILWLVVVAAVLTAAGLTGFRRRDTT
ncbi:MAG: hypothetical protein JWO79_1988 [Actinomycetia bacterium]|nr:hypothetical protein [Actinomycetes bacterium]